MTAGEEAAVVDERGAPRAPHVLVRVEHLAKSFGPTQALRDCSFELRAGEVHALVGENGSGKSTLVKIISGVHVPDSGQIEIAGAQTQPRSPKAAQEHGIVTVFQEVLVAEARSVLDNVWLGADSTWRAKIPAREKRLRAREALTELLGRPVDLSGAMEELSLSDRQACCIVRALLRRPRILILDEATSALDVATRDRLFALVGRLAAEGVGVIFITHRMDEIEEIGDRITVMRSGETVANLARGAWTPRELVRLMTGSDKLAGIGRLETASAQDRRGAPVLSVRGLRLRPDGRPIDLEVRAGELIGLAGLEGHGQNEFLEALWGENVVAWGGGGRGEVVRHLPDGDVVIRSPVHAADCDIAYVPRERGLDSLFSWMTIRENFALPTLGQDTRLGWLSPRLSRRRFASYIDRLQIVLGSPEDAITTLSGGNQQRVIIARWLAFGPHILLLNDPTRGIDINAKNDLYALFGALASDHLAVVMLSTELDEHVELMDRVLVFREHELFRELDRSELSREALVAAFFGESGED
ncbi:MAG TPA: sugar ABC transporter ATP-binding protein [Streptosporangiaceae bacterium]|nr:sugar ABC transporter ATP-binding protein [Streptosporangiaceae bacterium]